MVIKKGNYYKIDTLNTSLIIKADEQGAGYIYYGKKVKNSLTDYNKLVNLVDLELYGCNLFSAYGGLDTRRPFFACMYADGSLGGRYIFKRAKMVEKPDLTPLPSSYTLATEKSAVQTICFEFIEEYSKVKFCIYYTVYADSDVISVSTSVYNGGKKPISIKGLPSLQLDIMGAGYSFTTFRGDWAEERQKRSTLLNSVGMVVNESVIGSSSHNSNPFVMLEKEGSVYAFNLIYSGNHKETAEEDIYGRTRVAIGINDFMLNKTLASGENFFSPEAVMVFAENEDEISERMNQFVSEHIIRGKWKGKERPIVINNWEGTYFNFNREKILAIADAAVKLGVEMFVLDDGWFGHRDNDDSSLGDWFDYVEKTGGIAELADAIREKGLKFGIWVEPEMISEDSELYKKHPEFAMKVSGREPLRMRNQLMLNMADVKVQKYVIRVISAIISDTKAAYVKWDYNRRMSDPFGKDVPHGEYFLEYMKGYYTVVSAITKRFPNVLFEGCAGGGGRFDLGNLCFFPQYWTSDDTDPRMRLKIQTGTSFGYPQSAMSCHVSASPNHQTRNRSALETRFNVAAFGAFGYETDTTKLTEKEEETIKKQIVFYKKWRKILQQGKMYRLGNAFDEEFPCGFITVSYDKSKAVSLVALPRKNLGRYNYRITLKGLDPDALYKVNYRDQDNYNVEETFFVGGDLLMNCGLSLNGLFQDFSEETSCNPVYTRVLTLEKTRKKDN